MTDLALFALSAAGVTVTSVVALLVMSIKAHDSEKRAGQAELNAERFEASSKQWEETANAQTKRANALDKEIDELVASMPDDPAIRSRMHAKWLARRAKAIDDGAPRVPVEPAPAEHRPGPDDLLKPGE